MTVVFGGKAITVLGLKVITVLGGKMITVLGVKVITVVGVKLINTRTGRKKTLPHHWFRREKEAQRSFLD